MVFSSAGVYNQLNISCNLLLVIAANDFLLEGVRHCPYNCMAFTWLLMGCEGERNGIIQLPRNFTTFWVCLTPPPRCHACVSHSSVSEKSKDQESQLWDMHLCAWVFSFLEQRDLNLGVGSAPIASGPQFWGIYMCYILSLQYCEVDATVISFIQMWKLRIKEVKQLAHGYQATKGWNQELNSWLPNFRDWLLT